MRKIDATKLSDRALARVVILDALIAYLVINATEELRQSPPTCMIAHLNNMLDAQRFLFRSEKAAFAFGDRTGSEAFTTTLESELTDVTEEMRTQYHMSIAHGHEEQRADRTRKTAQSTDGHADSAMADEYEPPHEPATSEADTLFDEEADKREAHRADYYAANHRA